MMKVVVRTMMKGSSNVGAVSEAVDDGDDECYC